MIEVSYLQHVGLLKNSQQDALWNGAFCVQRRKTGIKTIVFNEKIHLAISDGVSSSPYPGLASKFLVENLLSIDSLSDGSLRKLHLMLCEKYSVGCTHGSAATLVAAYVNGDVCQIANSGDSRAYLISGYGGFEQVSYDHVYINNIKGSNDFDVNMKYASIYNCVTDCYVADYDSVDFDISVTKLTVGDGDALLLTSDGVHGVVEDEVIKALHSRELDTASQVKLWAKEVLRRGAPDNFSIIYARFFN